MSQAPTSTGSRIIQAPCERVYHAFLDPQELLAWLPPADMQNELHSFDARVGGGYRMSLYYPPGQTEFRGKTTDREDRIDVRFTELSPPERIVEKIRFDTTDPAFEGEMTMTATFEEADGGTKVTMLFENLPPGLRPEDNDEGTRLSLDQLAKHLERNA